MPNAELLIKEAEGLPPEYFTVVLDLIRSLKQTTVQFHAAALSPTKAPGEDNADEIGIPAWKFFGHSRPPTPEEVDAAIREGCGIAARMGSTFSSDKLLENRLRDKEMEEIEFRRWFHRNNEASQQLFH
jgi:hypothetical protein